MRILIDSTQIPLGRTGAGVYADHLIQQLGSLLQPDDRLFVLVQSDDIELGRRIDGHRNLSALVVRSSIFRNRLALAFYEQCILPWVLLFHRIDVVHSLHYTFPLLCPARRVVTLHDMTHTLYPEMHTRGRTIAMSTFAKLALRRAEGVLFVSNSTRKDAERLFGQGRNLRAVTPLAVDHAVFDDIDPTAIDGSLTRIGIDRPYILFLGTLEPRKNVERLVHAFDSLGPEYSNFRLIVAGKPGWHYEAALEAIENSPNKARIQRIGYVAPEDKAPLIAGCELLVYPSLYEGFGLPVLEGMAAGVPVITSNASSMPEIAGEAAVLIDPYSTEQIAAAIGSILSDENLRQRLRRAGKAQAAKFSWEKTASLTCAAYRELARTAAASE
jgi:glycosyltransferase involved in cell wall biosynthesis